MSLFAKRLLIVTGKGGVGKSTVAAALGLAAAAGGSRTAIVELSGQHRMARLYGVAPRGDGRPLPLHPNLEAVSVDSRRALADELSAHIPVGGLAARLADNRAVAAVAAAAPGLKELLALSVVRDTVEGHHDLVVLDAPATGHAIGLLEVPRTVSSVARMGPVRQRADALTALLEDANATAVVVVSTPDELAVSETLEAWERLAEGRVATAGVIANMVLPPLFADGDAQALAAVPDNAAPTAVAARAAALARVGRDRLERERLQRLPHVLAELPLLFCESLDRAEVTELAGPLEGM